MDVVIKDFLTGEHSSATQDKKKATLMCQVGKLVGVRDDGTVLLKFLNNRRLAIHSG